MAVGQSHLQETNGVAEIERLQTRICDLEDECLRLKHALAAAETERAFYKQAFLDQARTAREFEDLDVAMLERMSAGPVEML